MTPNTHEHPPSLTALTCQPPHLKVPGLNNCTFYHSVHAKLHNYILICRFVVPTNPPHHLLPLLHFQASRGDYVEEKK